MTVSVLPELLHRGIAIFILSLGIGILAMHTYLVTLTAQHSTLGVWRRFLVAALVGAYLTIWLSVAIIIGDRTNFPMTREGLRLPISLLIGFGPMFLGIAILFASKTMRHINGAMPLPWLIWAQTYRVGGLIFLYPFLYYGLLPAAFSVPASLGDFVTGLLAPFVGFAVASRRSHAIRWAIVWNAFGVLDLILAPIAAVLSQARLIGLYPLSLVPLFIGPPMGILVHVYSIRNLAVNSVSGKQVVS
ncbi:MAG TPA: hypothetical protein VFG11_06275 [Acidobacteriota bacterium]|nr:hypothetical protein [Acidobacteriota bacterium]